MTGLFSIVSGVLAEIGVVSEQINSRKIEETKAQQLASQHRDNANVTVAVIAATATMTAVLGVTHMVLQKGKKEVSPDLEE